ncbi:MAG: PP2C family protein-serine/threonine phosphatase [Acidobacteriota bacterium]
MIRLLLLALATTGIVDLTEGWRYATTPPRATPPGSEVTWRDEVQQLPGHDYWYRTSLPAVMPADARLIFRSYTATFDVFVDQQRIYTFDDDGARGRLRLHVALLPAHAAGRTLTIRFPPGERRLPLLGGNPFVAAPSSVPAALMRLVTEPLHEEPGAVLIGAVVMFLGLASIAISRIRRGATSEALLWFGIFATLYGARLIVKSYVFLLVFGRSRLEAAYLESWITYAISIPGWMMARRLLGDGWKSTLRLQVWAFTLFAPVAIVSDLLRREPKSMESVNNVFVIVGGVCILINLLQPHARRTPELRVVLVGSAVFMTLALVNNLSALGVLPFESVPETLGFLLFVGTLNYAALRMFLRGERERVALEGELATARVIQRSLLPTSMPDVHGLRFAARYDPASAVAGDLYDFVAADETHVGLLVADVAGHGVPAALIASMVKVAVSSHVRLADDPATMLRELNDTLLRDVRRNFVTATYLWIDMHQRKVSVSNAGHAPPVIVRGDTVLELGPHGVLLGRFAIAAYGVETVPLVAGDRIAAWTDGIVETRNRRDEPFGEERLHDLLRKRATADDIVDAVLRWRAGDLADADDLTIVIVEVD